MVNTTAVREGADGLVGMRNKLMSMQPARTDETVKANYEDRQIPALLSLLETYGDRSTRRQATALHSGSVEAQRTFIDDALQDWKGISRRITDELGVVVEYGQSSQIRRDASSARSLLARARLELDVGAFLSHFEEASRITSEHFTDAQVDATDKLKTDLAALARSTIDSNTMAIASALQTGLGDAHSNQSWLSAYSDAKRLLKNPKEVTVLMAARANGIVIEEDVPEPTIVSESQDEKTR
jgi:hypothetical protein